MVVFVRYFQKEEKRETYYGIGEVKSEIEDTKAIDGDYVETMLVTLTNYEGNKRECHNVSDIEVY